LVLFFSHTKEAMKQEQGMEREAVILGIMARTSSCVSDTILWAAFCLMMD
jgi:hypothetical protein